MESQNLMQKSYYEDQYIHSFTGEIIDVLEIDNEFHIELENTYFYPDGGGQPFDTGFIENLQVKYVYENKGHIYHVADKSQ